MQRLIPSPDSNRKGEMDPILAKNDLRMPIHHAYMSPERSKAQAFQRVQQILVADFNPPIVILRIYSKGYNEGSTLKPAHAERCTDFVNTQLNLELNYLPLQGHL